MRMLYLRLKRPRFPKAALCACRDACRHFAGTHHQNCFLNYLIIKKFFADVGWWKRLRHKHPQHCLLSSSRCLWKWDDFGKNENLVNAASSSISSINVKERYGWTWDLLCGWRRCVLAAALIGCLFCVLSLCSLKIKLFWNVILSRKP